MFCPMRLTYSSTTGSVMNLVLFSISSAYCLPILISLSVEYQLPNPRAPMLRLPTALTSSMLPGFTFANWLPGSTTFSGFTWFGPEQSPPTGVVPGAGCLSFAFLSCRVFVVCRRVRYRLAGRRLTGAARGRSRRGVRLLCGRWRVSAHRRRTGSWLRWSGAAGWRCEGPVPRCSVLPASRSTAPKLPRTATAPTR